MKQTPQEDKAEFVRHVKKQLTEEIFRKLYNGKIKSSFDVDDLKKIEERIDKLTMIVEQRKEK